MGRGGGVVHVAGHSAFSKNDLTPPTPAANEKDATTAWVDNGMAERTPRAQRTCASEPNQRTTIRELFLFDLPF